MTVRLGNNRSRRLKSLVRTRSLYASTVNAFCGSGSELAGTAAGAWAFDVFGKDLLRTVLFLATGVFAFATGIFPLGRTRFCRCGFAPAPTSATAAAPARNSAKL